MKESASFEAHAGHVLDLCFTPDGGTLVSAGMDNAVKLWSVPGWQSMATFEGHSHSVNSLSMSPDAKTLATGSSDQTARLWSFPEGQLLRTLHDRKKTVAAVAFSSDGNWLTAASYGGRAVVWSLAGQEIVGIKASKKNLSSIAVAPDSRLLATAGLGDDIQLWSLPSGEPAGRLGGHKTAVGSLRFIQEGRQLVSLGYEQAIRFWDTGTWQEVRTVQSDRPGVRGLTLSPGATLAALSLESMVQLWSVPDWTLSSELPVGTKVVSAMAFSPDGRWLAAGAADRRIRVWEL